MNNSFQKLRQVYNEAMVFFDNQYVEFQNKIKYKPLMKLVIENRRLELINKVSRYFKDEGINNGLFSAIVKDVNEIKNKTTQDLLFLAY